MFTIGMKYIASLLEGDDTSSLTKAGLGEHMFKGNELEAYQFVLEYFRQYGELPTEAALKKHTTIASLPKAEDATGYYVDELKRRYLSDTLTDGLLAMKEKIKAGKPEAALELMSGIHAKAALELNADMVKDFRAHAYTEVVGEYAAAMQDQSDGLCLGWPYFDNMSSGLFGGDLVSFVGRPAQGKTFKMLYSAMHGWRAQKKNILFVSMEMNHLTIFQRMAAMYTHLNLTNLKKAQLASKSFEKLKEGLHKAETEESAFWVAHGNLTVGVDELMSLVQYLKPDAVFIDGAYLLQGRDRRANRFERVAENTRVLKSELSTGMDVPTIASWQFNREAAKKAKKAKAEDAGDLEDIGFADEIGQLSSIVLGLFEAESVETMMRRRVEILKGRGGEIGSFLVNWNFYKMDFSQYYEKNLDQLQFV